MKNPALFLIGFVTCLTMACSGSYLSLNPETSTQLDGTYQNISEDKVKGESFLSYFKNDTFTHPENITVVAQTVGADKLKLTFVYEERQVEQLVLEGSYKRGGFVYRKYTNTEFIAGPLIWARATGSNTIRLTKSKNLVIESEAGGTMFLIFFPIFGAERPRSLNEFKRIN